MEGCINIFVDERSVRQALSAGQVVKGIQATGLILDDRVYVAYRFYDEYQIRDLVVKQKERLVSRKS